MYKINELTRNFHDQIMDSVIFENNLVEVQIDCYEKGSQYGIDGNNENKVFDNSLEEVQRTIKITFHNVLKINQDFKFDFEDLDIMNLIIKGNHVVFELTFDHNEPNNLEFDSDSFELKYIK